MRRMQPKNWSLVNRTGVVIKGCGWECREKAGRNLMRFRTEYLTCKLNYMQLYQYYMYSV